MRQGLLRTLQFPPGQAAGTDVARLQENVRDAVEVLAADHDVHSAPTVRFSTSGSVPSNASIVVFSGPAGCSLALPFAAVLGPGVGLVMHILNLSTVAVSLVAAGADTINSATSLSLGAGKLAIVVADGVSSWKAATS